ncbi:glycosyltransferase family 76 protein [Xylariaceae sp. FL0594]|nr:glycosyltransferase family 76 protein [Xylariaceae sp. FL0594]
MALLTQTSPFRSLVCIFIAWKSYLFALAIGSSVGPAYDTSSTLLSSDRATPYESAFDLPTRLTRWDAIYYIQASRRGYLYEQEWAFASGLPTIISFFSKFVTNLGVPRQDSLEPLIGIVVTNFSHLLSVLVLFKLGQTVTKKSQLSFIAAVLHIISPAGLFLSAPFSESPYSLLSFTGYLFFAKAVVSDRRSLAHDVSLVASGLWFGLAVNFRSNGILNGIPFAVELLRELSLPPTFVSLRRRLALIVGGSAIAIGVLVPQLVAYLTYCHGVGESDLRPWCTRRLPSIYTFVQEHYWNVGFLRYWTLPNVPLFLLATPMLYLLLRSGTEVLSKPHILCEGTGSVQTSINTAALLRSTAFVQTILAALAITNYHVQVITRLSSGYPVWYWWLAGMLSESKTRSFGKNVVVYMVMYASIQGVLFASFLPPA